MRFLAWLEASGFGEWVRSSMLAYPLMIACHAILGLCLLIGAVLIMDLRLIGFQRVIPLSAVHSLMPVAVIGFGINVITGVGFLFGNPYMYAANYAFWIKMALVLLAGLNFLLFVFKVEPSLAKLSPHAATPASAKAVGAASLVFWFGVLTYGRLLPYLGVGGG